MKKFLASVLVVVMAVAMLTACGGGKPSQGGGSGQSEAKGYSFTYKGTKLSLHDDSSVLEALGEPKSYTEEASCAFDGLDKTYFYGSFYVTTYPDGDKDKISSIWFADDTVQTEEGLCIGDNQDKVESLYGADSFNGTNAYVVKGEKMSLTVIVENGSVTSVSYDATF